MLLIQSWQTLSKVEQDKPSYGGSWMDVTLLETEIRLTQNKSTQLFDLGPVGVS